MDKFWSDDFDMDLLKVFPQVVQMLGASADEKVWTVGHSTYGRLNHPVVWNSHGAFVWLNRPNLKRDEHGWFNVRGCVDNAPEIECTFLELLRDQWPHSYAVVLIPTAPLDFIGFPPPPQREFMEIMYDLRGWHKSPHLQDLRNEVLRWIVRSHLQFVKAQSQEKHWHASFESTSQPDCGGMPSK